MAGRSNIAQIIRRNDRGANILPNKSIIRSVIDFIKSLRNLYDFGEGSCRICKTGYLTVDEKLLSSDKLIYPPVDYRLR
jgi:hypothetical protein